MKLERRDRIPGTEIWHSHKDQIKVTRHRGYGLNAQYRYAAETSVCSKEKKRTSKHRVRINYRSILQNHIFTNTEQKYLLLPFEREMFAVS
jgi:hypothetical protein